MGAINESKKIVKSTENVDYKQQLECVSNAICETVHHDLTDEIITSALYAMKNNPNMTPHEAMQMGMLEWDV